VSITQLLVELVGAAFLGDGFEWIRAEVFVDIQQSDCLHQGAQDNLLVIGEVELKYEGES
jgi:hypothetical protein